MAVPKTDELINPTLAALHALGGSASIGEIVDQVISSLDLPEQVTEEPLGEGGRTKLEYRLAWARTYLKKFGMVDNSGRGVWALTTEGSGTAEVDPKKVVRFVQQDARSRGGQVAAAGPADTLEPAWQDQLLGVLLSIPPDAFERLCQRLLRESGFIEVEVTGRSGDGGIDGNGIIRLAGLISFPVVFQAKRHKGNISASIVRDFRGAMVGRAEKGVVITTGSFTPDARREATRDGAPPIDLIDGELLCGKLKELELGVATRMVEEIEVDSGWFSSL